MRFLRLFLFAASALGALIFCGFSSEPQGQDVPADGDEASFTEEETEELDSEELREGEVVIENGAMPLSGDWRGYSFLNIGLNSINLNGDDWGELRDRFAQAGRKETFSIVHIGDSHLQADIGTARVRTLFQNEKGNAGRGIIVPWRLSGSNEPLDYKITLNCGHTSARILKQPWPAPMAFTGIGITPNRDTFTFTFENRRDFDNYFRFLRLYATGPLFVTGVTDDDRQPVGFSVDYDEEEGYTDIFLARPLSCAAVSMRTPEQATIHGAWLSAETDGLTYHVIGNNGATYYSYNSLPDFGKGFSTLYPDLIIVSLGTNEAFGKITSEDFYAQIHACVNDLKAHNPDAKVLLTTPMECRRRRSRGRGRRRRTIGYQTVENCHRLRDVIVQYGTDHSVPVYDWFMVAGGDGAAEIWMKNSLLSSDGVHNTRNGYELFGELFHAALRDALNQTYFQAPGWKF